VIEFEEKLSIPPQGLLGELGSVLDVESTSEPMSFGAHRCECGTRVPLRQGV